MRNLILVLLCAASTSALACSTCRCGDPTLTLMGNEKPFTDRKRLSLEYAQFEESTGLKGVNLQTIEEQRWSLGFSWSPNDRLALAVKVPWVERQMRHINLASDETSALGDVEFSGKWFLQPQATFAKELYGFSMGLRVPTSEEQTSNGEPLDIDVQPGAGAWVPNAGVWYSRFRFPWVFYTSATLHYSTEGHQDFQPGEALVATAQTQYALNYQFAAQLGLDARWSGKNRHDGEEDPDSGGFISFITPGAVVKLKEDLILHMNVQIPLIEELDGQHEEEAVYQLGVTYDF